MPDGLLEVLEGDKTPAVKSFGSKLKRVFTPILSALKLIAKGSYVVTLIIMMVNEIIRYLNFIFMWSINDYLIFFVEKPAVFYMNVLMLQNLITLTY